MSIEDRNLKPGTVLVARYKKEDYRCTVVEDEDGRTIYRVHGGKDHKSPSAAGSAVMGGVACNGWRFWSVEGTETPAKPKTKAKAKPRAKAAAKSKPKAKAKTNGKAKPEAKANGKPDAKAAEPVACGQCKQKFPNSREAAEHIRKEHGAPEAAGNGGK